MKQTKPIASLLLCLLLLASCSHTASLKPTSGGRNYEVLIVDDCDQAVATLLSEPMPALPQPEPMFDVRHTTIGNFNATQQLSRNIIVVCIDRLRYPVPQIVQERNVYAHPQLVTTIGAPTATGLKTFITQNKNKLLTTLTAFEMGARIAFLKQHHNPKAEQMVQKLFGFHMLIPADMQASKQATDFLWLSNNTANGLQNICIYKANGLTKTNFQQLRDSVMQANIKGETNSMYMQTVPQSCLITPSNHGAHTPFLVRGLWQMHGDAMGGPFIGRIIRHKGNTYVAEGFVFAPENKKRNFIRQLESALYTLKTK